MTILITGGAGFIGSNFVIDWLNQSQEKVINLDKLTYAGRLENLKSVMNDSRHCFVEGDIADKALVSKLFQVHAPRAVIHFAAESHVDKSIENPDAFIETNIIGTHNLLSCALTYADPDFRFLHVSTDEVYGSLGHQDPAFTEQHPYQPNSPYSASKAASDHLVRAYHHTYGLPVLTSHCSNNYGPRQFPEKLIPLIIKNALAGKELPLYGDGMNIRDWLYVSDHCSALRTLLESGKPGESYNIGGKSEKTNTEVVAAVCDTLDKLKPKPDGSSYKNQVHFVKDRPGHDFRYAINPQKIENDLGWKPSHDFSEGIQKTVEWYLTDE
jgi:dTDP-glucose 4,6-dehydratase